MTFIWVDWPFRFLICFLGVPRKSTLFLCDFGASRARNSDEPEELVNNFMGALFFSFYLNDFSISGRSCFIICMGRSFVLFSHYQRDFPDQAEPLPYLCNLSYVCIWGLSVFPKRRKNFLMILGEVRLLLFIKPLENGRISLLKSNFSNVFLRKTVKKKDFLQ